MKDYKRLRLIHLAAEMYYLEDKTQQEVADTLGVSRPMVSRLLSEAREEGIVRISVIDPLANLTSLSKMLKERLGLTAAIVVAGSGDAPHQVRARLGSAGARYLTECLKHGSTLGLGWGRTLYELVSAMETKGGYDLTIVPLIGGLGQIDPSFQVHSLASIICEKLGGTFLTLYVPAIVENRAMEQLLWASRDVASIREAWQKLDVALVGIGLFDYGPDFQMLFANYLDEQVLSCLEKEKAVGDVCMRAFDIHGRHITEALPGTISIDEDSLLKIPRRIGVAGGRRKAEAILGAVRGGYINILVTDDAAAQRMLELLDEEVASGSIDTLQSENEIKEENAYR